MRALQPWRCGGVVHGELADDRLGRGFQAAQANPRHLDRLEAAGMVKRRRDTDDRRRVWVELVPAAQKRLQHAQQPIVEQSRGIIPPKIDKATGEPLRDGRGRLVLDYDLATPMMLVRFFPAGLLGLGLTALLASFMSGMAGNVTAFNTVWTYDIYQSYIRPGQSDGHYLTMGRIATVAGVAISLAAAYVAASFNNIMDMLQLVFAFVNAPLFATFALGMFW